MKTIIVFGADGFVGWPVTLNLSKDHHVIAVDSLTRREGITRSPSLTEIGSLEQRYPANGIDFLQLDVLDGTAVAELIARVQPAAVVHLAEQRSAPWSMLGSFHAAYTVQNNVNGTLSILDAITHRSPQTHLVHIGTMGVYGYSSTDSPIPEGYLTLNVQGEEREVVYPPDPGSIYHMTKVMDHQMFQFYAKNWRTRITDLHQGIVWGTQTEDTARDPALVNRFDYDGEYGTVLNRFLVQAAMGQPLTVYGTGGQTRAFIHIQDCVRCVRIAIENDDQGFTDRTGRARPRVFNQVTETANLLDLAKRIQQLTGCEISFLPNPRKEKAENGLSVNSTLTDYGLQPTLLSDGLLQEVLLVAKHYGSRFDESIVKSKAIW